jgi:hypothetical protein
VQFEFAACLLSLYHSRLAQSWAGDGIGFSIGYSTSPILAAHYPCLEYTGSISMPTFFTAYPRLKNNGGRHQFAYSVCKSCLVNILHHSFRRMPKKRQPPPFGYSKLPVTTNQPGSVFQYHVVSAEHFCLVHGALCNTCQHQFVVTGLHVSAAFRVSQHITINLLINMLFAA